MKKRLIELTKELERLAIDTDCEISVSINPGVSHPTVYAINKGKGRAKREFIDDIDLIYAFRSDGYERQLSKRL